MPPRRTEPQRPHFCLLLLWLALAAVAGKDNDRAAATTTAATTMTAAAAAQRNAAGRHKSGFSQPEPQMFLKGFAVGTEQ